MYTLIRQGRRFWKCCGCLEVPLWYWSVIENLTVLTVCIFTVKDKWKHLPKTNTVLHHRERVMNLSLRTHLSLLLFSIFESQRLFGPVTHSKPLDPPHYGQQITVSTETHFDGSACRQLRYFAWINTPASKAYQAMSLSRVCEVTVLGDSKQQPVLLHFTCAETKHMALCG